MSIVLDPIDIRFQHGRQLRKLFVQFIRQGLPVLFDTALEMAGQALEFSVFILNLYFYLLYYIYLYVFLYIYIDT